MKHPTISLISLLAFGSGLAGCMPEEALKPPAQVQLACAFAQGQPTMVLVLDTGLETAQWLNLQEPRRGTLRVSAHQYQLEFPAVGRTPVVRARIDRYEATIMRTVGVGKTAVSQSGRCAKQKTGRRLSVHRQADDLAVAVEQDGGPALGD